MSVQLVLYPQNHEGQYNSISQGVTTDFIVDGINFSTVNSSSTYEAVSPTFNNMILNAPTTVPNTWYRARTIQAPTVTPYATMSGNKITFGAGSNAVGDPSNSYLYQRMTDLIIGQEYTITAEIESMDFGGAFSVIVYMGAVSTGIFAYTSAISSTTTLTGTFIAQLSTTLDIYVFYSNSSGSTTDTCVLNNIYVTETGVTPTYATNLLSNGQVIVDLYEDEDIPLTLSVDDFKNVAEKVQSYSKAFNLPATKRNNLIFDNVFSITRSADGVVFNPYRKTQCILKQDGFTLFEGYLRMIDITTKDGETSYNVNMFSEAVALADVLKDKKFYDLDLSELESDYNYTQIRNSWQGVIQLTNPLPAGSFAGNAGDTTTDVLRYPFCDWSHSYTETSDGFPKLENLESSFRPFINIKYLIDNIFAPTDFSYTSDFFETADFKNLFMDFNWGEAPAPKVFDNLGYLSVTSDIPVPHTTFDKIAFPIHPDYPMPASFGYDDSTGVFTATTDNQTYYVNTDNMEFDRTGLGADATLEGGWIHETVAGALIPYDTIVPPTLGIGEEWVYDHNFTVVLQTGDKLYFQCRNTGADDNLEIEDNNTGSGAPQVQINVSTSAANTTNESLLQTLRGEIGQWEFLKGIMTMFNLISIPDKENPNNIIIEPYNDVFINNTNGTTLAARSIKHDWTEKIDVSEIKLTPLTELNKTTIFKFVEDDDDYPFSVYKNSVPSIITGEEGHLYGSAVWQTGIQHNVLSGTDEIVAEPFAATVIKPLMEQFTDFVVPSMYSLNSDGVSEPFDNSPRILYKNGVRSAVDGNFTSCTYFVPDQNGSAGDAFEDEYLLFSHLTDIQTVQGTTKDFHFGACQLMPGIGSAVTDNLFSEYWQPYYAELYSLDTRVMTLKVNLSAGDIGNFNMYDTVFIKDREYRVNRIDYKPHDLSTVEFILIP